MLASKTTAVRKDSEPVPARVFHRGEVELFDTAKLGERSLAVAKEGEAFFPIVVVSRQGAWYLVKPELGATDGDVS